jgi:hypothetical protein
MTRRNLALAGVLALAIATAHAPLFDRGGGLIYDDVLKITWLSDANYAMSSSYDTDGRMNWRAANTWAAGLSHGGYDDWRLPTALNQDGSEPCNGGSCAGSEMGPTCFTTTWGQLQATAFCQGQLLPTSRYLPIFSRIPSTVTEYLTSCASCW